MISIIDFKTLCKINVYLPIFLPFCVNENVHIDKNNETSTGQHTFQVQEAEGGKSLISREVWTTQQVSRPTSYIRRQEWRKRKGRTRKTGKQEIVLVSIWLPPSLWSHEKLYDFAGQTSTTLGENCDTGLFQSHLSVKCFFQCSRKPSVVNLTLNVLT